VSATGQGVARSERVGWYFYDWANSAFVTTVATVLLGPYLTSITRAAADASGYVYPLGIPVAAGSFFPYVISASVLGQVLFLPLLGAIADFTHLKREMLAVCAYGGAVATMGLYWVDGTRYALGGALFVVANVCFGASIVFYNAYLPEIAPEAERDVTSSRGWALGYLGGGILLAANLYVVSQAESLGLTIGHAVRICLLSAGAWWAIFTLAPVLTLRRRATVRRLPPGSSLVTVGFAQLLTTVRGARMYPQTLLFLGAYLLYNDGIQSVIALSSQFGQEELGLPISTLTSVILLVQFVAFAGALLFGRISARIGTKRALISTLVVWTVILAYAYLLLRDATGFYVLGGAVAVVLGGSQALSRSAFSRMIPRGQEAEYFSLYELGERGTSWLGPLLFGLALQFTGSYRIAIVSLVAFFAMGLVLLVRVRFDQAYEEARR
jgi:UMF1 family MFS transporter